MKNTGIESSAKQLREMIRHLERKIGLLDEVRVSCCELTFAQCHAVVEIGRAGRLSLNDLAGILGLDKSTMSRTINNLVQAGLTSRELDPADRRYVVIGLTDEGKEAFREIETRMNQYFTSIYERIPENCRGQVLESLKLLNDAFDPPNS